MEGGEIELLREKGPLALVIVLFRIYLSKCQIADVLTTKNNEITVQKGQ